MAHSCEEKKCTGPKTDGLCFTCAICSDKTYVDCALRNEEVCNLMVSIEMMAVQGDKLVTNLPKA